MNVDDTHLLPWFQTGLLLHDYFCNLSNIVIRSRIDGVLVLDK
jgi:hypothetical protein